MSWLSETLAKARDKRDRAKAIACDQCAKRCASYAEAERKALGKATKKAKKASRGMPDEYRAALAQVYRTMKKWNRANPDSEILFLRPKHVDMVFTDTSAPGGGGVSRFRTRLLVLSGWDNVANRDRLVGTY